MKNSDHKLKNRMIRRAGILPVFAAVFLMIACTVSSFAAVQTGAGPASAAKNVAAEASQVGIESGSVSAGAVAAGSDSATFVDKQEIGLDPAWKYADFSIIHSGKAVFYKAPVSAVRKGKIVAVNAGHGTKGGESRKTYSHPDKTGKVTGGTNAAGAVKSMCVSSGMNFKDGTPEKAVTLRMAQILREKLLAAGYDVLMIRDGEDVQLDNIARTVIANNCADIHIALHWDGDGLKTIKGAFYMSVPDALKNMEPVKSHWQQHEKLGDCLIKGLETEIPDIKIWNCSGHGQLDEDLTQTSFSTVPSVDIELGNQCSRHDDDILNKEAAGLLRGIEMFFAGEK